MDLLVALLELCITIVRGNIWVGTAFWIGLGMFFVFGVSGTWGLVKEADGRIAKALLGLLWLCFLIELLVVIALCFVEIR